MPRRWSSCRKRKNEPKFSKVSGLRFFNLVSLRISGGETVRRGARRLTATDKWQSTAQQRREHVDIKPPHTARIWEQSSDKIRHPLLVLSSPLPPLPSPTSPLTAYYRSAPSIAQSFVEVWTPQKAPWIILRAPLAIEDLKKKRKKKRFHGLLASGRGRLYESRTGGGGGGGGGVTGRLGTDPAVALPAGSFQVLLQSRRC